MEIKHLEQAGEMLKAIQNYLLPFNQKRSDKQLEQVLSELDHLIEFCNQNEFVYVEE